MAGAIQLAREWNTHLVFVWVAMPDMNAKLHQLFRDFPYTVIDLHDNDFLFWLIGKLKTLNSLLGGVNIVDPTVYAKMRGDDKGKEYLNSIRGKRVILNTCENVTDSTDFSMFNISRTVKKLSDIRLPEDTIGVHIRRTDNKNSCEFSPTELFIEQMRKEVSSNPAGCFYLSTDDADEERKLKEIFGERIIVYPKRSLDRNTLQGQEDALIDLHNLSCCKKILASYYSSFSTVAAEWGKIEKIVIRK